MRNFLTQIVKVPICTDLYVKTGGLTNIYANECITEIVYIYIYIYINGPRIGGVEQTQTSHRPKLRTNPKFEQI